MCLSRRDISISRGAVRIFRSAISRYTPMRTPLSIGRSAVAALSPSSVVLLYVYVVCPANFTERLVDIARSVRPTLRERACLFARGGGSSVSPPRAVGISISYSTAVDEACYFPCVRRLVRSPLTPPMLYNRAPSSSPPRPLASVYSARDLR